LIYFFKLITKLSFKNDYFDYKSYFFMLKIGTNSLLILGLLIVGYRTLIRCVEATRISKVQ